MSAIPLILTNPLFIAVILTALATGAFFFESWLDMKYPSAPSPIKFTSGRKAVSLPIEEILYVESNDDFTTVYATGDRCFRNITPISQWEAILKPFPENTKTQCSAFIRILQKMHKLVNEKRQSPAPAHWSMIY